MCKWDENKDKILFPWNLFHEFFCENDFTEKNHPALLLNENTSIIYFLLFPYLRSETDNRSDIRGDLDHAFTDELLQKIESLTNDKSELSQALQEAKVQELKLNQKLEASRQSTLLASIENTKGSKNR